MTRQDYEAIAAAIRNARVDANALPRTASPQQVAERLFEVDQVLDHVIDEIAHVLSMDNRRFNKKLFVEACQ